MNKETVVIEPFQVPTDLEKQNITGQAIVNKLIDQIELIKAQTDTSYEITDFKAMYQDAQLEIVIPGSGISLKSLMQNVKNFLGKRQTRITGEVVLNQMKLFLTVRVQGEPAKTFSGELAELDNLLAEAARYVLKFTQPYLLAYFLYYNYEQNKEEALEMIRYTISHPPKSDDAMAFALDGFIKLDENRYDESIALFRKSLELNPKYIDAINGWGYALYEQGHYDQAIEQYANAVSINPNDPYAYHYWGMVLEAQGKEREAIEYYEKSLSLFPDYSEAYAQYGEILAKQGKYDESFEKYSMALQTDSNNIEALNGLSELHLKKENPDKAVELINRSLRLNQKYPKTYLIAGDALSRQQKYDEANRMYGQSIALDSANKSAYTGIGENLEHKKNYVGAIETYEKAIKLIPGDSAYFAEKINEIKLLK